MPSRSHSNGKSHAHAAPPLFSSPGAQPKGVCKQGAPKRGDPSKKKKRGKQQQLLAAAAQPKLSVKNPIARKLQIANSNKSCSANTLCWHKTAATTSGNRFREGGLTTNKYPAQKKKKLDKIYKLF